jgi:hypothetical protein
LRKSIPSWRFWIDTLDQFVSTFLSSSFGLPTLANSLSLATLPPAGELDIIYSQVKVMQVLYEIWGSSGLLLETSKKTLEDTIFQMDKLSDVDGLLGEDNEAQLTSEQQVALGRKVSDRMSTRG